MYTALIGQMHEADSSPQPAKAQATTFRVRHSRARCEVVRVIGHTGGKRCVRRMAVCAESIDDAWAAALESCEAHETIIDVEERVGQYE